MREHATRTEKAMTVGNTYPTIGGHRATIRMMCMSDADMEAEFVRNLSVVTKHYRFLGAVKELSPADLKRFCDVDGRHSMAMIATVIVNGRETPIGVGRYAPGSRADNREMAITVADGWQGKGLEALLVAELVKSAKHYDVKQLFAVELPDNSEMQELAKQVGMSEEPDSDDAHQVIYTLSL